MTLGVFFPTSQRSLADLLLHRTRQIKLSSFSQCKLAEFNMCICRLFYFYRPLCDSFNFRLWAGLIYKQRDVIPCNYLSSNHSTVVSLCGLLSCTWALRKSWSETQMHVYIAENCVLQTKSTWGMPYPDYRKLVSWSNYNKEIYLLETANCNPVASVYVNTIAVLWTWTQLSSIKCIPLSEYFVSTKDVYR